MGIRAPNTAVPPSSTLWPAVAEIQKSDLKPGLARAEVASRIAELGEHAIEQRGVCSLWRLFSHQFASPLVVMLLCVAVASVTVGITKDAVAILAIVLYARQATVPIVGLFVLLMVEAVKLVVRTRRGLKE